MPTDYKKLWAQTNAYERLLADKFEDLDLRDESGIYVFTRYDESGLKFAYVGQAKKILTRLAQHMLGREQHIDLSIYKRKLYNSENPYGWNLAEVFYCPEDALNEEERRRIRVYAEYGYQLLNKTAGGQDAGKIGIAPNAPGKGYRDGLKQGYENARKFLAPLFEKYLAVSVQGTPNKIKARAMEKFLAFIVGEKESENG